MTNHPKIQLGPDNLYINDKPITDMTIEERIEDLEDDLSMQLDHEHHYEVVKKLHALLRQVQDEQKEICTDQLDFYFDHKKGVWCVDEEDIYNLKNAPYAYPKEES